MHEQPCPVCFHLQDVRIYVTGQRVRCTKCGLPFVVERSAGARDRATAAAVPVPRDATRAERRGTPAAQPAPRVERARPDPAARAAAEPAADATMGTPGAEPIPVAPVIPGYTILTLLGQGAMGAVWKAQHGASGETCAIKILVEHLARTKDFILRFEREAAAMGRVRHSGVVGLRDSGHHGGVHYLVMEYVDGEPIRREMERTRMPPPRAVAICRRVARGLEAAHRAGIVHRDLKPENILLSRQGELKIVDFGLAGLAHEVDPHPNLTRSRVTMGTMNYMAPEQRTDAKRVDKRADIYSLGVILYEMFTRELPMGRFALPGEKGLPLPPLADEILRRALAQSAENRHQTAAQLDAELAALEREMQMPPAPDDASGRRRWWPFQ